MDSRREGKPRSCYRKLAGATETLLAKKIVCCVKILQEFDFTLKLHARFLQYGCPNLLDQAFDVFAGGAADIDDKSCVLGGDLCSANC